MMKCIGAMAKPLDWALWKETDRLSRSKRWGVKEGGALGLGEEGPLDRGKAYGE